MKADSGATGNYIRDIDKNILQNLHTTPGPRVQLPDASTIQSQQTGYLPIPGLSQTTTTAHVFKDLQSSSLLSVGKLCDDNCQVVFDKHYMHVYQNKKEILRGDRNNTDRLWDVPISKQPPQHNMNVIIKNDTTTSELIQYFQGCCFSPSKSTFLKAVQNGNFITWPGLTPNAVKKYYKRDVFVAKGYLNQERANLQSTKLISPIPLSPEEKIANQNDHFPIDEHLQRPTKEAMALILPFESKYTGYMDLTGRFPYRSSNGNEYIMVIYDYDSNAILAQPLKNRQVANIRDAFNIIVNKLAERGAKPKLFILDNEISGESRDALKNTNWTTNWHHHTNTDEMQQNGPSKPSSIIF